MVISNKATAALKITVNSKKINLLPTNNFQQIQHFRNKTNIWDFELQCETAL